MIPVQPAIHQNARQVLFAATQPQYNPLIASVDNDGCVMTEWLPSAVDLANLMNGGHVRIWLFHTGVNEGLPLTPMSVETTE